MRLMLVAGEASGDMRAGELSLFLKELSPGTELVGAGGRSMRAAGVELLYDLTELALIGFSDVFRKLGSLRHCFSLLTRELRSGRVDGLVLVDFPDFNLRLARRAKAAGVPVVYYISPQVWAWRPGRIKKIAALVDRMLVIFSFETELYEQEKVKVDFVGHPLLDRVKAKMTREEAAARFSLSPDKPVVALLPGSRQREVRTHLPIMLEAAAAMRTEVPELQFVLPCASPELREEAVGILSGGRDPEVRLVENATYEALNLADLAIAASGTTTLEAACLGTPLVVIYRLSFFNWLLAKPLVRLENIALVNVVAGERIVPELLQFEARPDLISQEALRLLREEGEREVMVSKMSEVRKKLGSPGASKRAARLVLEEMEARKQGGSPAKEERKELTGTGGGHNG